MIKQFSLFKTRNLINLKRVVLAICLIFLFYLYTINYFSGDLKYNKPYIKSRLDSYDFNYQINNDICVEEVYLLILVHSSADHFRHRQVIRDTWGNTREHLPVIKVVFLLAVAENVQKEVEEENNRNKDILQGSFIDSYHNLTYKHVMGLSWASTHCNKTKFILKMDDDIFMDIFQLIDYIENKLKIFNMKNSIACYRQKNMPVVRDPVSKWFVSKLEYSSDTFDDYCSGWAYLTTIHAASVLHRMATKLPYFWVDDVHITGTVRKKARVRLIRLNHLYALETDGLTEWCNSKDNLKWNKVFSPTWGDLSLVVKAHDKSLNCYVNKCTCCYFRATTPKPITSSTTVKGMAQLIPFSFHKRFSNRNNFKWKKNRK